MLHKSMIKKSQTGRGAAWQRACFGSRKSPVQIWAPRPAFVSKPSNDAKGGQNPHTSKFKPWRIKTAIAMVQVAGIAAFKEAGEDILRMKRIYIENS